MKHREWLQVTSCHVNPVDSNMLMSSSNDWTAKIFDIRNMSTSVDKTNGEGMAASDVGIAIVCPDD